MANTRTSNGSEGTARKPRGRQFPKGTSGNLNGRPPGSRNQTTVAAEALLDGEAEALTRKVIDLAHSGDRTALRICFDRIVPPRRERRLSLTLPNLSSAADAVQATASIFAAAAAGEITLGEAARLAKLVDSFVEAIKARDFEERLRDLEARDYEARFNETHRST